MDIFFAFTPTPLSAGVQPMMRGGVSSNHPPSGCPIFAQDESSDVRASKTKHAGSHPCFSREKECRMVFLKKSFALLYIIYIICVIVCAHCAAATSVLSSSRRCHACGRRSMRQPFIFSSSSMCLRLLLRRGTLCCPPSFPFDLSQSLKRSLRAFTISRCCSVMFL